MPCSLSGSFLAFEEMVRIIKILSLFMQNTFMNQNVSALSGPFISDVLTDRFTFSQFPGILCWLTYFLRDLHFLHICLKTSSPLFQKNQQIFFVVSRKMMMFFILCFNDTWERSLCCRQSLTRKGRSENGKKICESYDAFGCFSPTIIFSGKHLNVHQKRI